jgi:outer membrane receptor protein involved in Fe transport
MNIRIILVTFIVLDLFSCSVFSQKLTGLVFDENTGSPISSVAVFGKNASYKAITDSSGYFVIQPKYQSPADLHFSHINYKKQSLRICRILRDTIIRIALKPLSKQLAEVQITASPLRQVLTRSYSVTIIDSSAIENKIATSLIDILEEVPGITKQAEYHSPIALRGLKGKRLLITKDGNRRMGNFTDGFMGQGINIYDLAKVEVIKGPASVKYGPGAITGIINMESKQPFFQPGLHGRVQTSYGLNNHEKNVLAGLNWCNLDHAFTFSGRLRDADDFHYGDKNKIASNSAYHDKDLRLAYSFENNYALRLTAESELHIGGPWGKPVGFNGTSYMKVYNNYDDTWHSAITTSWKPENKIRQLEVSVYFDKEKRDQVKDSYDVGTGYLSYRENISYTNYYFGWRTFVVTNIAKNIELTSGSDGVYYRIESPTELTDYFLTTIIKNRATKNAGISLAGIFTEAEYFSPSSRLKLRAGLRADYSYIHEGDVHDTTLSKGRNSQLCAWNGTAGIVYNVWPKVFISFQIARSCRMPDATEMFIASSNTDGMIYGNSSLVPEYGFNFDAGIRGKLGALYFDCSLFSNLLHNFISLEYWTNSGKKGINYTYYNIDKARIMGVEFSTGAKWLHILHPDNTVTYNATLVCTQGDKMTGEPDWFAKGVPLRNIPPFNTRHEITFRRMVTSAKSFYIGLDYRYYAAQNRIAPSSDGGYVSPYYNLVGTSAGFTYRRSSYNIDIKLRIDNLTNNYFYPFESLVPGMGRNFKVLASITL